MRRAVISALFVVATSTGAGVQPPPVPSPARAVEPDAIPARPARGEEPSDRRSSASPKIRLGQKQVADEPGRFGVGEVQAGKGDARVKENQLLALVTGSVSSHTSPLAAHHRSEFRSVVRLVQEFDLTPVEDDDPRVKLSMAGRLDGFLRTGPKGVADLCQADAVLFGPDGSACLSLGFPCGHASDDHLLRCTREVESQTLVGPPGRYVLVVTLALKTSAVGVFRGHAEAIFAPGRRPGTWTSHGDAQPPTVQEGEEFGLAVTVRADAPPND